MENVIKVWSSTFNARSLIARARKELPLESDPIGVAVLTMVDADAAGVMFTAEPTTADATKMIIEGSHGLGEIVVSGAVIPDNWTVDAGAFAISDRSIASKGQECLSDDEVIEIASRQACRGSFRQAAGHRMGRRPQPALESCLRTPSKARDLPDQLQILGGLDSE